jgi:DUF1009 family protein
VARIGRRPTSERERGDMEFAREMARRMAGFPVGRSVIVKEKSVLVVEANEGTVEAVRRAGRVCRNGGFVVVRTGNPTVDETTLRALGRAGGRVLAIEADGPDSLGGPEWTKLADRYGVSIVVLREIKE